MILVSLGLNVLVLVPVTVLLAGEMPGLRAVFGERTPARDILLAIYGAILTASAVLMGAALVLPDAPWLTGAVGALLTVQVFYKGLTALTVRNGLRHPVVLANLAIAVVHAVTLIGIAAAFR
ncbi:hypothetical protein [Arthrobacter antioxidans]|uniref:hypothetical protein n=1 Tax=Arthrobacter antioxidans TaxID=2895818 RepID=UPI001FFFAE46|nr:hypothetical protein [Arthrobacter antioxidans]